MATENKDILDSIDSSNIFDDFDTGTLKEELDASMLKEKKDKYDHIHKAAGLLSTFFWVGLLIVGGLYGYIKIQNNTELNNVSILNPICRVIVGKVPLDNAGNCMSINAIEEKYNKELSIIKESQSNEILGLMTEIYKIDNFNKSKEVIFLNDKSNNRLKVLEILNEFDELRYNYDPVNMQRIQCEDFNINEDFILTAKCIAYSSDFAKDIKGFDGTDNDRISGTSISVANSFLNYIDKQSDVFTLIDRQKKFQLQEFFSEYTNFSKKTDFDLKLQYDNTLTNK